MPADRLPMRDIREILRLSFEMKLSHRKIGQSVNKSPSTVGAVLGRFAETGLQWPLDPEMNDAVLEERLYGREKPPEDVERPQPDWKLVDKELRRKDFHVSRFQVWREYHGDNPYAYEYSWFCREFDAWKAAAEPVMRQVHKYGEKCFVDYAGDTVPVIDPSTGEVTAAQIFVGVMGASNYTFVSASPSQSLPHWIQAHADMFSYFGACPSVLVPDNLKGGVTKAEFYEPSINPTYNEMAKHFDIPVIPARKRKPKDKAKVENGVLVVSREILAPLRNRTFFNFVDLNEALDQGLEKLNCRPFQKLPGNRRELFVREELPLMKALPGTPYDFGIWRKARVHMDYHVDVDRHFYSVPHLLVGQAVEVRQTVNVVEVYHLGIRVASHLRSLVKCGSTTLVEHMPASHRAVKNWTPQRLLEWAGSIGGWTQKAAEQLLLRREHPEQGSRSVLGLLNLKKANGQERLEEACRRALSTDHGTLYSYKTVKTILEKKLDGAPTVTPPPLRSAGHHDNVRGKEYYADAKAGAPC